MRKLASSSATTKVAASIALVSGTAAVAGLGTFGAFTSTTSASEVVSAGTVVVNMSSQAGRGLDVPATGLVPGDTVQRAVVLKRGAGSETFGSLSLTTTAANVTKLTSDATDGLQLAVDRCSKAWTKVGSSRELTCSGDTTPVIGRRAVLGANLDLGPALTAVNSTVATANLRVTLTMPASADNTFQDLTSTVTFTFDATQRAAQAR